MVIATPKRIKNLATPRCDTAMEPSDEVLDRIKMVLQRRMAIVMITEKYTSDVRKIREIDNDCDGLVDMDDFPVNPRRICGQ